MSEEWSPKSDLAKAVYAAGFLYSPELDIIYSRMDAAQRYFGYTQLYDDLAPVTISSVIDCEPVYFDFDEKKWMIEFWKGQYGIETGAEIGVYVIDSRFSVGKPFSLVKPFLPAPYASIIQATHPRRELLFYYSADNSQLLEMSFVLIKDQKVPLFERKPTRHWWLTGFKWGEFSKPSSLRLDWTIRFPSPPMAAAFAEAIRGIGYDPEVDSVAGTVSAVFGKPRSRQSIVRKTLGSLVLSRNKKLVALYESMKQSEGIPRNDPNVIEESELKTRSARQAFRSLSAFFGQISAENGMSANIWKEVTK